MEFIKSRFIIEEMSYVEKFFFFFPLVIILSNFLEYSFVNTRNVGISYKLIVSLIFISISSRFVYPIYRVGIFGYVALPGLRAYRKEEKKSSDKQNWSKLHQRYSSKALNMIKKLGGIFYKVGQVFGSRSDISPEEYQKNLNVY